MAEFGVEGFEVRMALTYGPTLIARGGYPQHSKTLRSHNSSKPALKDLRDLGFGCSTVNTPKNRNLKLQSNPLMTLMVSSLGFRAVASFRLGEGPGTVWSSPLSTQARTKATRAQRSTFLVALLDPRLMPAGW